VGEAKYAGRPQGSIARSASWERGRRGVRRRSISAGVLPARNERFSAKEALVFRPVDKVSTHVDYRYLDK
jgi:hypothetical protein